MFRFPTPWDLAFFSLFEFFDFRCLIVPRFVFATGDDFASDRTPEMYIKSETIQERLAELASATVALTKSWNGI